MFQKRERLNAIRVGFDGWIYLSTKGKLERGGKPYTDEYVERLKRQYENRDAQHGGHLLMDGDIGGCVGDPTNAFEEGRWTDWDVEQMKEMLDAAGYTYKDEEPQDVIQIYI